MEDITITTVLAWLLATFFLFGTAVNLRMPENVRQDYARWGYPGWFHYVTAVLELATAIMLLFPVARPLGALLGIGIMAAAAGTVLIHREYKHAVLPSLIFFLLGLLWWMVVWAS